MSEPISIKTGKPYAGGVGEQLTASAAERGYTSNEWGGFNRDQTEVLPPKGEG